MLELPREKRMQIQGKATALWGEIFNLRMPQMRAFHMTWFSFFLCFFAWFGIAPLMKVVRDELQLTQSQIGWSIIASVSITVIARLFFGWLCDRIGPRLSYTWLLTLGSLPVMMLGLANDPWTFIFLRLMLGVIGAAFVITQYHTSLMFASNIVGTANATSAGWGNMGGGAAQLVMPVLFGTLTLGAVVPFTDVTFFGGMGVDPAIAWRVAMLAAGATCFLTGIAYFLFTQDCPEGNFKQLRAAGRLPAKERNRGAFWEAARDRRVWALFLIYGACFGIELTVNNVAALYFADYFGMGLGTAGAIAASFGLMNLFARTLGGFFGDLFGGRWGLQGRVTWLFMVMFCEGLALMLFSQVGVIALALPAMLLFSLFVQMAEGATFSVVPFINKRALGAVAGIVGAGGNAGAVAAGFLFKGSISWPTAFLILGGAVTLCSFSAFAIRFSPQAESDARREHALALTKQRRVAASSEQEQVSKSELQPAMA